MKRIIKILVLGFCAFNTANAQTQKDTVHFDFNKYELNQNAKERLNYTSSKIELTKLKKVTLYGNTDSDGDSKYNVELSKKRANAVADYLVSKGFSSDIITQVFDGESKPMADERTDYKQFAKEVNRRVELVFEFEVKEVSNDLFSKLQPESQFFEGKSNQDIEITGKAGTKIKIPKNSLMKESGKYAVGKIKLELKEFYKKSDMLLANLHTMSNRDLLESGGMIFIEATNNGEKLQLKKNAKMTIEMASKNNKSDMQVFYGYPTDKSINWDTAETVQMEIESTGETIWYTTSNGVITDTLRITSSRLAFKRDQAETRKLSVLDKTILQSAKLNWINCDRFSELTDKTDFVVDVDLKYKPEVRLVFKDINSIMSGYLTKDNKFVFDNVPAGRKATIVAFSNIENETYIVMQDVVISKELNTGLELQKTTLEDLKARLRELD